MYKNIYICACVCVCVYIRFRDPFHKISFQNENMQKKGK